MDDTIRKSFCHQCVPGPFSAKHRHRCAPFCQRPPPAAPPECSVPVSVDSDGNRARSFGGVANQAIGKEKKIPTGPKSARFARPETKGHSETDMAAHPRLSGSNPHGQTPLKTGEIPPSVGQLERVRNRDDGGGDRTGIARSLPCKLLLLFTPRAGSSESRLKCDRDPPAHNHRQEDDFGALLEPLEEAGLGRATTRASPLPRFKPSSSHKRPRRRRHPAAAQRGVVGNRKTAQWVDPRSGAPCHAGHVRRSLFPHRPALAGRASAAGGRARTLRNGRAGTANTATARPGAFARTCLVGLAASLYCLIHAGGAGQRQRDIPTGWRWTLCA